MRIAVGVGLAILAGAIYGQSIGFGFAGLDDPRYVTNNQPVLDGLSVDGVRWAFTTLHAGMYLPLTWLSLMANSSLQGTAASDYRLTNVLLHAANAFLVFRFFDVATKSRWRSLLVAALFAAHPLHVESVVWVTERKDVLSIFFGLAALNAYAAFVQKQNRAWLAACWVAFICSLLAKQTLVTLPFLLLLLDYWPFERFTHRFGPAVREKLPFFLASFVFSWLVFYAQTSNGATAMLPGLSFSDRAANAVASYGQYLLHLVWPLRLAFFYPYPGYGWDSLPVAFSLAVLLMVSGLCVGFVNRRRELFVGWFWFLGTLIPMVGLVQVGRQGLADRFVYFPMIGIYVMFAWFPLQRVVAGLAPLAVAASAMLAFVQVGYWKDNDTLFQRAIQISDNESIRGYYASWLITQGRLHDALDQLQRAVTLAPASDFAHERLGLVLESLGRNPDAITEFERAITLRGDQPAYYTRLATALSRQGREKEAAAAFARAVQLMPELEVRARRGADPSQTASP
jgi:tetratricopeptide (TPR) repeat protein